MLGRAILRELGRRDDICVLALYRSEPPPEFAKNIENQIIDLDRPAQLGQMLQEFRPTTFIHTAATGMQQPLPDRSELLRTNVELPLTLAKAASEVPHCHFVHVSSGLAYKDQGRPARENDPLETHHPYGASKVEAEKRLQSLVQDRNFPLTIVRPFSFTGQGDFGTRLFPSLLHAAVERRPFEMSPGDQVRDHSSVNDIARGVIASALQSVGNSALARVFNLGTGDTRPLREIVRSVIDELGVDVDLRLGAKPYSPHEPMFTVADATHARKHLPWRPEESVAHAVWELARASFPSLNLSEPPVQR
jgi:nucleoside-diphosphate-sugar epimerase